MSLFQLRLQQKNELLTMCIIAKKNCENLQNFMLQILHVIYFHP